MAKNINEQTWNIAENKEVIKNEIKNHLKEIYGVDSIAEVNEITSNLRMKANSLNPKDKIQAKSEIKNLVGQLSKKIFTQELYNNVILEAESLVHKFNDGYLDTGDTKEYLIQSPTGFSNYDENEFVPGKLTALPVESQQIAFYQADGKTLQQNSRKWRKSIVIVEKNLIQWFLSGKMSEFIADIIFNMAESLLYGQLHEILTAITTATPRVSINLDTDTSHTPEGAKNAADAWVKIFHIINDFKFPTAKYAYGNSQIPIRTKQEDIMIFGSVRVFQHLKNMKAFIYHSNLFQPIQDLTDSNFFQVPPKLIMADDENIIKTGNDYYLDDNTLYIIDTKNFMKILYILQEDTQQFWASNLANSFFKHLWYTFGILNWGKIAKVTSTKFLKDEVQ